MWLNVNIFDMQKISDAYLSIYESANEKDLLKSVELCGKAKKKISFPKNEISSLSKVPEGGRFYTTRVSDDYGKFKKGDILSLPWNKCGYITKVIEFTDLDDHPFRRELTNKEVMFLKDYDRFKVLEIQVISA